MQEAGQLTTARLFWRAAAMTIAIDSTVGSASANSYNSLAEVSTYLEARLNAEAWTEETDAERQKAAMVEAFREINLAAYIGTRASSTQSGQWPRQWAVDPDQIPTTYFATDAIPQRVKDAHCELALEFLRAGSTDPMALSTEQAQGIAEKTIDVLTTRWFEGYQQPRGIRKYPRISALLAPLYAGSGNSAAVVRG
jgi:DnaT-like ssDNA binding protein